MLAVTDAIGIGVISAPDEKAKLATLIEELTTSS